MPSPAITSKQLNSQVAKLNKLTGSPTEYWADRESRTAAVGHFHLGCDNNRRQLLRTVSNSGGVTVYFGNWGGTKSELWGLIQAYMQGWNDFYSAPTPTLTPTPTPT